MPDDKKIEKKLSTVIFENLRELLKAKNAAHESIFKFHWKKLWPFSLIWPQVDYLRIIRFMDEIKTQASGQKDFIRSNRSKAEPAELPFLNAVPDYLDALCVSCDGLAAISRFKQDLLEKVPGRKVMDFKRLLDVYEKAQNELVRKGAFVQVHWMEISPSVSGEQAKGKDASRAG